jgi:hypothetical protein
MTPGVFDLRPGTSFRYTRGVHGCGSMSILLFVAIVFLVVGLFD